MNRQEMIDIIIEVANGTGRDSEYPSYMGPIVAGMIASAIIAAQGDEDAVFHVRKDAPDTSKAIVDKIRSGSLQAEMLDAFMNKYAAFGGATDDELERFLGRSHQSVSGCRNALVRKGYVYDTGHRRMNSHGNMAIVWYYTDKEVKS